MSKIILITGASAGFGKAIATKFAAGGWNLILTARRKEKLDELAQSLEASYGIKTLCLAFDIQDKKAVFAHLQNLPTEGRDQAVNACSKSVLLFHLIDQR